MKTRGSLGGTWTAAADKRSTLLKGIEALLVDSSGQLMNRTGAGQNLQGGLNRALGDGTYFPVIGSRPQS